MGKNKNKNKGKYVGGGTDNDSLTQQLRRLGFAVKEMEGDGNCLFRALGDQYEGNSRKHVEYRLKVADYIKSNRSAFEPFIEDDMTFDDHVTSLAEPGTYGGNDAIVAFSRIFDVTVVIHQSDSPAWAIHPRPEMNSNENGKELHISYHNGDHYNSVVKIRDAENNASQSGRAPTPESKSPPKGNRKNNSPKQQKTGQKVVVLPDIQELKITDNAKENEEEDSAASGVKQTQKQPVKQSRRQILEQKKKMRKLDALQRKKPATDPQPPPATKIVGSNSSTLPIKVLTI